MQDLFNSRDILKVGDKKYIIYRLDALEKAGLTNSSGFRFRSASCSKPLSVNAMTKRSHKTM